MTRGPLGVAAAVGLTIALAAFGVAGVSQARPGDRPEITGSAEVGETLTSSPAGDTAVYKWERCDPAVATCGDDPAGDPDWVHIAGASDQSYLVADADAGFFLRVSAKGTSLGESFVASLPVGPVNGTPPESPPAPKPKPKPPAQTQNLEPDHGQTLLIDDSSGTVLIKIPGDTTYRPVTELREIPIGSFVDATGGTATITSENGDGADDKANFWGGVFQALQDPGSDSFFEARLGGTQGRKASKRASNRIATTAAVAHTAAAGTKLWGSGTGKFRTRGKGGAATLRGTTWLTKDKADGTLFKVVEGHGIDVKDFGEKGLITLVPGDKYFAQN